MKLKHPAAVLIMASSLSAMAANVQITGAGSSFVYPVMSKWTSVYATKNNIQINYQSIGSGGGIRQLQSKTIDFAASDMPLNAKQLNKQQWTQFPIIVGGIVPVVNIKGVKANQLVLSGPLLSDIYSAKVKYWDDPNIKKLNPKLTLPHAMIIPIHRADGSGTTFNFTNYLSKVSPTWKKTVGSNTLVQWPSFGLGAKGNAGVANQVETTDNSIGYVEFAYAHSSNLTTTKMLNAAGRVVAPTLNSFKSAAANAKWSASNHYDVVLTNAPGATSWPIAASTFVLLPKQLSAVNHAALNKFFNWVYTSGGQYATKLDYVAIPKSVYFGILKQLN